MRSHQEVLNVSWNAGQVKIQKNKLRLSHNSFLMIYYSSLRKIV